MIKPRFEDYRFEIRPLSEDEGGGFLVTFPDLPGCMADGATYEEAIADARDAFANWIETYEEEGREIPLSGAEGKPAKFVQRLPKSIHQSLTSAAAAEGVSVNSLVTIFVADGLARREERLGSRDRNRRAEVQVIGVGGVGSQVIEQLRALTSALVLVDPDDVVQSNRFIARTYQLPFRPGVKEADPIPYVAASRAQASTTSGASNVIEIAGQVAKARRQMRI